MNFLKQQKKYAELMAKIISIIIKVISCEDLSKVQSYSKKPAIFGNWNGSNEHQLDTD